MLRFCFTSLSVLPEAIRFPLKKGFVVLRLLTVKVEDGVRLNVIAPGCSVFDAKAFCKPWLAE